MERLIQLLSSNRQPLHTHKSTLRTTKKEKTGEKHKKKKKTNDTKTQCPPPESR